MSEFLEWGFYDPKAHVDETSRNLPHKEQAGAITFVTMRLADSMPREVVAAWHAEISDWLASNGLANRTVAEVLHSETVTTAVKQELRRFKNRKWFNRLDDCFGKCELRHANCRSELVESLFHFNGERYDLDSFVVMPNHAHVLIQMREPFSLRKQFREIQRYSARNINRLLDRKGVLWQPEPFDHIVRSSRQLIYLRDYIAQNPVKANLPDAEFTY
jgi:type I restriction enzyme R subunit